MYDIIIIGAGPGGYVAAERAGAKGKKVLLVEKANLGGVCLNEGCIPTKTLLHSAKQYVHAQEASQFGVHVNSLAFDLEKAMEWKGKVIDTLRKGIAFLMKKYKVDVLMGSAKMAGGRKVDVNGNLYEAENVIIATGSSTFIPPIPGADGPNVITSTEALLLRTLPKSLTVIGGGVIGVEFASFFSSFGVRVYVVEMMDEIIPFMDREIAENLRKAMKRTDFILGAKVESITPEGVIYSKDGKTSKLESEIVLMAVGRRANLGGMGFEQIGLDMDKTGIKVNERMQTNLPGIYAIGDVTGKLMLAHAASRMGEVAVNTICGEKDRMRFHAVPWAVYGIPESAGCGMTELEAIRSGYKIRTATSLMRTNGRFLAENGGAPGLCKVIVDSERETILGVHMFGGACSEMIYGAAVFMEAELTVKEIKEIIFPHPSVSEIIKETIMEL
jgi:dihydrolipoamide dehydrogenase